MIYDLDNLRDQLEQNRSDHGERREGAACFTALRYRRDAGPLVRQLADRTEAGVRRELERLFLARPELTDIQRAAIAQAMSQLLNQLLHRPRVALRAAAGADDAALPQAMQHAARRVLGLAGASPGIEVAPHRPEDRHLTESLVR